MNLTHSVHFKSSLSLAVELGISKVKKNRSQELKFHQIENDLLRFLEMMNV